MTRYWIDVQDWREDVHFAEEILVRVVLANEAPPAPKMSVGPICARETPDRYFAAGAVNLSDGLRLAARHATVAFHAEFLVTPRLVARRGFDVTRRSS